MKLNALPWTMMAALLCAPALFAEEALDYEALHKRVEALKTRLAGIAPLRAKLQSATEALPAQKSDEMVRLAEQTRQLRVAEELAAKRLESLTSPALPATLSAAELERKLAEARKERDSLVQKLALAAKQEKPTGPAGIPGTVLKRNLKPIGILLVRNRAVPIEEPHFHGTREKRVLRATGEERDFIKVHRVSEGTPVTDAVRPGDLVDKLINEANASKTSHFFVIKVCADSIPAYRTLVNAVTQRGYDYSWDTGQDKDWYIPADGRGNMNNGPVRVVPADGK